jgi:uncharacterized protein YkwD
MAAVIFFLISALHGVPFEHDAILTERAEARAEYLCESGQWSHDHWLESFDGIRYSWAGENLAKGYTDPVEVVMAWVRSPAHFTTIINKNFTHAGIGIGSCGVIVNLFVKY